MIGWVNVAIIVVHQAEEVYVFLQMNTDQFHIDQWETPLAMPGVL